MKTREANLVGGGLSFQGFKTPHLGNSKTFEEVSTRRVSYILTTKNRVQFIRKGLEIARSLMGPTDELIVVDGGSTDGTAEIISGYGSLVGVFLSESDCLAPHALNKGMLLARGKYVKHLTDDDEFSPSAMEHAIQVMEVHPDVDVLVCGGIRIVNGKPHPFYLPPGIDYGKAPEDVFKYGTCGCGIVIRRSALAKIGLSDATCMVADGDFVARAIKNRVRVKFCRVNLFRHPIYEHSTTRAQAKRVERDTLKCVNTYCSLPFYLSFLAKRHVLKNPWLLSVALKVQKFIKTIFGILMNRRPQVHKEEPIWDGGFS